MKQIFANNSGSRIAVNLSSSDTTLVVDNGTGNLFPTVGQNEFFLITLYKLIGGVEASIEIVKCVGRNLDTFTIVRGQEGTIAQNFVIGDFVELRVTKGTLETLQNYENLLNVPLEFNPIDHEHLLNDVLSTNNARIPFSDGTTLTDDSNLFWDNTNKLLNATNGVFSGTLALGNVTNSDGILIFANQTKAANIARYTANLQTTVDDTIALTGNITHFGTASRVYSGLSKAKLSTFTMTLYGTLSVGGISGNGVASTIYGSANQGIYNSNDATHTLTTLVGVNGLAQNSSSGDITNAYGGFFQSHCGAGSGSQVTTNSHGVYSTVSQAAGTVTTGYLYRGAYSGTVGTKYGLHLAGCDINYLSGRLLIGSTSDNGTDALQITGSSNFTSDVTAGGVLSFGSRLTQHINLYGTTYALGVQTNTTYIRTNGAFCLFRGGIHSNTQYAPGTGGTEVLRIDATNNLDLRAGDYYRAGVKLLGARRTGWTAATGTATRTTFATASVTLPLLAERVKALIDDLLAHGIIGA